MSDTGTDTDQQQVQVEVPWGLQAMQMPTRKEQAALFAQLDFNGNGVLSLAEVDAAVTAIWPTFTHRAAVLRAFRDVDPHNTGLLDPGGFGTLLSYLSAFAGVLDDFDLIDTSHDHRLSDSTITKEEVVGACALLKVGVTTAEARQTFDRMEQVRPNHILFDDFAGWIAGKKIGLRARRSSQRRTSASPRTGRTLASAQPVSPRRLKASSPSPRRNRASSTRQARASTPSSSQPRVRKAMAQATIERLHNEDRDRRAAREQRAQAAMKERDEAEMAEIQMAPKLNQTSLAMAKRANQTDEDSGAGKSFIERDKQWLEAREQKLETHRRVLRSEREESVGKGTKMSAKSHVILEKTGRLRPNTPIADRLHSAARAQQEKARLKREMEDSAEARRKNTVYSAYVPGGRVRLGQAPCGPTSVDRQRRQSAGDRLLQHAKAKEQKLEAARREAREASLSGLFTPRLNRVAPKQKQRNEEHLSQRIALAASPPEPTPELSPEPEPQPELAIDPKVVEEEKRHRRMKRRAQQNRQRESAARLLQKASDSQKKKEELQQQVVKERDRQTGALADHMENARASVMEAKHATRGHHARKSEFLQKRRQYSSPARQRRPRSSSNANAKASSKSVLEVALQKVYEGLTSQHAARDVLRRLDKDHDGMVGAQEVKLALRHLHLNLNEKQVAAVIYHIGAGGDQLIGIEEFLLQISRGRRQLLRGRFQTLSNSSNGVNIAALFRQYDRHKTAIISFGEFERIARRSLRLPKADMTTAELQEIFDCIDFDGDKKITLDEFKEFLSAGPHREAQHAPESVDLANRDAGDSSDRLHRTGHDYSGSDTASSDFTSRSAAGMETLSPHTLAKSSSASFTVPVDSRPVRQSSSSNRSPSIPERQESELKRDQITESRRYQSTYADALSIPEPAYIDEMFLRLDAASQNQLSLSEVAQGVTELWPNFDDAPALMRAYRAADSTGDGWINAADFHTLLRYLAFFHQRWPLFNQLDEDHDGKIPIETVGDYCEALGLASPGGSAEVVAKFAKLDPQKKGWVAFEEFCSCAARCGPTHAWLDAEGIPDGEANSHLALSPAQTKQPQAGGQVADTSTSSAGSLNAFTSPITEEDSGDAAADAVKEAVISPEQDISASNASPSISRSPRSPQKGLTTTEAVEDIKSELGLESSLSVADAVAVAWEMLRLGDAAGLAFKSRVQRLCAELHIQPGWS